MRWAIYMHKSRRINKAYFNPSGGYYWLNSDMTDVKWSTSYLNATADNLQALHAGWNDDVQHHGYGYQIREALLPAYVGILRPRGLFKESVVGTLVTPPTEFLPLIAPDSFSEAIELLQVPKAFIRAADVVKVVQGPASLKNGKIKMEMEPENCGNILMALLERIRSSKPHPLLLILASMTRLILKREAGHSFMRRSRPEHTLPGRPAPWRYHSAWRLRLLASGRNARSLYDHL